MAKEITYKPKTSLALKTLFNLGMANNEVTERTNEYIKTTGLNPTQFAIINILGHKGSLKISEIYSQMLIKSGNKTMILDSLEKKNLVKRVYSKNDRREIIIELTNNGQKFFEQNNKAYANFVEKTFSVLTQTEQKELLSLLGKIYGAE
jgi:MarR family 2-MHQ and catechol resistance regulon transcriptional repressor